MELTNLVLSSVVICCIPVFRRIFFLQDTVSHQSETSHNRMNVYDFVRGISILSVIAIHIIWILILQHVVSSARGPLFVNALLRFAVPVFLIISGILLNIKDDSIKSLVSFYTVKFWRIFVPYILVVLVGTLLRNKGVMDFVKYLVTGNLLPPYYFIVILAQCYILYPFLKKISLHAWYLPVFYFISLVCFFDSNLYSIFSVPFVGQYIFFFAYGVAIRSRYGVRASEVTIEHSKVVIPVIIAMYCFLFFLNPDYYYNTQLVYGVVMFHSLLLLYRVASVHIKKALAHIGQYSLWIFLLHFPLVVSVISCVHYYVHNSVRIVIVSSVIIFSLSYGFAVCFAWLYKKLFRMFLR